MFVSIANRARPSVAELGPAKAALIAAGIEEFAERGIEGARVRQIAARSGQNIAAISYHFGGKEGLYHAIADRLTLHLGAKLQPNWEEADALLADPGAAVAACADSIRSILFAFIDTLVATEQTRSATLIMLREQQNPSPVFELMFSRVIGPMHERITHLLAHVWSQPINDLLIARAHAIVGQVLVFRAARATILRRTGWSSIGPQEIVTVRAALQANLHALLSPPPASS